MGATYFTVRMSEQEIAKLTQLAKLSGRSKGGVIKRLLSLSDLPVALEALGLDPQRLSDPYHESTTCL